MKTISIQEFYELLQTPLKKGSFVIDVRTPGEYKAEHIKGAQNYPLDQIKKLAPELKQHQTIYAYCNSGNRSSKACESLASLGLKNLVEVEGGMLAWKQMKYPYIKGKGMISIMRQVQIIAGSIVLAGVLLSLFISQQFIWLSAFTGAGLVFAGLSGTCAMGTLLSKMPWNR